MTNFNSRFCIAGPEIIKGMKGKIVIREADGPVSIMVKAYFDAKIDPTGMPEQSK